MGTVPRRLLHPGPASVTQLPSTAFACARDALPPVQHPAGHRLHREITLCCGDADSTRRTCSGRKVTLPSPNWGQLTAGGFMCSSPGRRPKPCRGLRAQGWVWMVSERDQPRHRSEPDAVTPLAPCCHPNVPPPQRAAELPKCTLAHNCSPSWDFSSENTPKLLRAWFWGRSLGGGNRPLPAPGFAVRLLSGCIWDAHLSPPLTPRHSLG